MSFAFLMSCYSGCYSGMITSTTLSLSHAFRKGSDIDTATIGFCGMPEVPDAWREGLLWQDKFFELANDGNTVSTAFDLANSYYQQCGQCARFAGDPDLRLVPKIYRRDVKSAVGGEVRDVNANLLSGVEVSLYEYEEGFYGNDEASPDYCIEVDQTGEYWLRASRYAYFTVDTNAMPRTRNPWHEDYIDFTTAGLLAAGYILDFEGDYGLVPIACTMSYAMTSVNRCLFVPIDGEGSPHPEWQISNWKAMASVHSWQYPS